MSSQGPSLPPGFVTGIGQVVESQRVSSTLQRLRIQGPRVSAMELGEGPACAVRLLIPPLGHPVVMPTPSVDGLAYPEGAKPPTPRSVTVRRLLVADSAFDVEVGIGHPGLLSDWARNVGVGDEIGFAGPKLFPVLPEGPLVLLGDESALPAIAVILDSDLSTRPVIACIAIEVLSGESEVDLGMPVNWLRGQEGEPGRALVAGLPHLDIPEGAVVWVAGEVGMARSIRTILGDSELRPAHIRACGYWKSGRSSTELDNEILSVTQELMQRGESLGVLDEFALALEPNR